MWNDNEKGKKSNSREKCKNVNFKKKIISGLNGDWKREKVERG